MKCQQLFAENNKKNITKCRLLTFLPSMLSINDFIVFIFISIRDFPGHEQSKRIHPGKVQTHKPQIRFQDMTQFFIYFFFLFHKKEKS